jgi:hypothetical protein
MDDREKILDRMTNEMVDKIRDRLKTKVVDRIRIPGGFFTKVLMIVALMAAIWMFRYEITPTGGADHTGAAYRLDRWDGSVLYLRQEDSVDVRQIKRK